MKKEMKRPTLLGVLLEKNLKAKLKREAKMRGMKMSTLARKIIMEWLERNVGHATKTERN